MSNLLDQIQQTINKGLPQTEIVEKFVRAIEEKQRRNVGFSFRFTPILEEITAPPLQPQTVELLKRFLDIGAFSSSSLRLSVFDSHRLVVDDRIALAASRQLLTSLRTTYLSRLPAEQSKEVALYALERIASRAISFEEQVGIYRTFLADIYQSEDNWREAAKVLCGIPLESAQK